MAGLLSSYDFDSILTGDKSLSSRPMSRVTEPLKKMNANITRSFAKLQGVIISSCQ